MADAYDKMVAELTAYPKEIRAAWREAFTHRCGPLFAHANRTRRPFQASSFSRDLACGCLTQIVGGPDEFAAETLQLTEAIHADDRIPGEVEDITPEHLPVFAEWQRKIDAALDRPAPVWQG